MSKLFILVFILSLISCQTNTDEVGKQDYLDTSHVNAIKDNATKLHKLMEDCSTELSPRLKRALHDNDEEKLILNGMRSHEVLINANLLGLLRSYLLFESCIICKDSRKMRAIIMQGNEMIMETLAIYIDLLIYYLEKYYLSPSILSIIKDTLSFYTEIAEIVENVHFAISDKN